MMPWALLLKLYPSEQFGGVWFRRCVPGISVHPMANPPATDTLTVAEADLVESATLVALTVKTPAEAGAV